MVIDLRHGDLVRHNKTGDLWMVANIIGDHKNGTVLAVVAALNGSGDHLTFRVSDAGDAGFVGRPV